MKKFIDGIKIILSKKWIIINKSKKYEIMSRAIFKLDIIIIIRCLKGTIGKLLLF